MREALGKEFAETRGAAGVSRRTCAESGKERRTATSAPPAEMFNAVANSNNSFPSSSRLRTKMGIASGRRGHFRVSISGLRPFNRIPQEVDLTDGLSHLRGQTKSRIGTTARTKSFESPSFSRN